MISCTKYNTSHFFSHLFLYTINLGNLFQRISLQKYKKHQRHIFSKKLENINILVKGNYNKTPIDRTVWYSFHENYTNNILRNREMKNAYMQIKKSK